MLHAPDVYMDKLAIGPGFKTGTVTMTMTPSERVSALAAPRACSTEDITVCVLERPRHEDLIAEIRSTGAAIRLITDGDVAGVMHCAEPRNDRHRHVHGLGGAPEGVLAAAALKCMGGQFFGKLVCSATTTNEPAPSKAGITNFDRIYTRDDLVSGDVIFAATGVTNGSLVHGHPARTGLGDDRNHPDALQDRLGAPHRIPHPGEVKPRRSATARHQVVKSTWALSLNRNTVGR